MGKSGLESKGKTLGVFTLIMINVSLILNLRGLPMLATYGFAVVSFLLLAALVFFVPTALVSAELATGWPSGGGIHAWTKEAFGPTWAFFVAWLEWLNCLIWLPTALGALAAILGFVIHPSLSENRFFVVAVILTVFWGATFLNFRGMETSGKISSAGAVLGVLVPGVVVVVVAILWVALGNAPEISMRAKDLLPSIGSTKQLAFFIGVLLMFMGIEISSAHAADVKNPSVDYPKAILVSALIVVAGFILGALAVATIVPEKDIDLMTGVIQALETSLGSFGVKWAVPIIGLMIVFGMAAQINSWLVGPAKFILATARNGDLPPFFHKTNEQGMPVNIMLVQAGIVTLYSTVYLVAPSVNASFWILTALASQLYLTVYIVMFLVALKLRYSKPDVPRAYRVPGGKVGIWVVVGVGVVASLFAFFMGFEAPVESIQRGQEILYIGFLIVGIVGLCSMPFLIQRFKKPSWAMDGEAEEDND